MKLNFNELNTLHEILQFVNNNISIPDDTLEVLMLIEKKVGIEIEDSWKPLSVLTPLNMKVIVKNIDTGEEYKMIRKELADSYSPKSVVMYHDDIPKTLQTASYVWRLP
ncbi:hypothetical protein BI021_gp118 [Salmonella phage NR01]|uniref:Uncharacterized protein n=1 Tax=Salmonella phage NR01 TaxID=1647411 RepID=A0A162EAT7_9CAUD|nr:hypothetical protein BI021_gp118 [Salmonella phage NR01]AKN44457.1 hypothetical protein NR01_0118 [Salmonella phage NR01]